MTRTIPMTEPKKSRINSLKVELEYYAARKETPEIEFFTKDKAA